MSVRVAVFLSDGVYHVSFEGREEVVKSGVVDIS